MVHFAGRNVNSRRRYKNILLTLQMADTCSFNAPMPWREIKTGDGPSPS